MARRLAGWEKSAYGSLRNPVKVAVAMPIMVTKATGEIQCAPSPWYNSGVARVLMISSEAAPLAKTGGLADVVGALPGALREIGCETAVVIPRYGSIPLKDVRSEERRVGEEGRSRW